MNRTTANDERRTKPDQKGVQDIRALPDEEFNGLWESVILPPTIKDRLLAQAGTAASFGTRRFTHFEVEPQALASAAAEFPMSTAF